MNWPWSELGLDGPSSLNEIRRAYAQRTKETHPEDDPEGFQRLHEAYQAARAMARRGEPPAPPKPPNHPHMQHTQSPPPHNDPPPFQPASDVPNESGPSWDFEQIFAEEKQQREQQWRKKLQARTGLTDENDDWSAVLAALQNLQALEEHQFPLPLWLNFLHSTLFEQVVENFGFVTALEDWLETKPALSREASRALLSRLGISAQNVPSLYFMIYMRISQLFPAAAPPVPHTDKAPRDTKKHRERPRWRALSLIILILSLLVILVPISLISFDSSEDRQKKELAERLSADFSLTIEPLRPDASESNPYPENSYTVHEMPGLVFQAVPGETRNPGDGQPGYVTNFSNLAFCWSIRRFAQQRDYELHIQREELAVQPIHDFKFHYRFEFPLDVASVRVSRFMDFYHDLEQSPWYQAGPPVYSLSLSRVGVDYYTFTAPEQSVAPPSDYKFYTQTAPKSILQVILKTSGLDEADFGTRDYALLQLEEVNLPSSSPTFYQYAAVDLNTKDVLRLYAYSEREHMIVSYPPEEFDPYHAFDYLLSRAEPFTQQKQYHLEFPELYRW